MKILVITEGYPPQIGGLEKVVYEISHGLKDKGHEVLVLTNTNKHQSYEIYEDQIKVKYISGTRALNRFEFLVSLINKKREISKTINQFKPDVISVQYIGYLAILFWFLNIKRRTNYVVSIHGADIIKPRKISVFEKILINRIVKNANYVISNSKYLAVQLCELLKSSYSAKIKAVGNGIHISNYSAVALRNETSTINIIGIGRFAYKKGFDILIRAFAEVVNTEKNKNYRLILAGGGPERINCEKLAKELGVSNFISFLGFVENKNIKNIFAQGDIFVLPSRNEPFGVVTLESMAYGIPVIVTKSGGVTEIIDNEKTGFVVEIEDYAAIAEKIIQLANDYDLRLKFRQNAFEHLKCFDWSNIIDTYEDILYKSGFPDNRGV
jgi:glycosyltransferase involved in cell wall biosynthesis